MQAFIHPFLARLFWSTPIVMGDVDTNTTYFVSNWSPYGYCNGAYVLDRNHSFIEFDAIKSKNAIFDLTFIDFAGSGLVHACGMCMYICIHHAKVIAISI